MDLRVQDVCRSQVGDLLAKWLQTEVKKRTEKMQAAHESLCFRPESELSESAQSQLAHVLAKLLRETYHIRTRPFLDVLTQMEKKRTSMLSGPQGILYLTTYEEKAFVYLQDYWIHYQESYLSKVCPRSTHPVRHQDTLDQFFPTATLLTLDQAAKRYQIQFLHDQGRMMERVLMSLRSPTQLTPPALRDLFELRAIQETYGWLYLGSIPTFSVLVSTGLIPQVQKTIRLLRDTLRPETQEIHRLETDLLPRLRQYGTQEESLRRSAMRTVEETWKKEVLGVWTKEIQISTQQFFHTIRDWSQELSSQIHLEEITSLDIEARCELEKTHLSPPVPLSTLPSSIPRYFEACWEESLNDFFLTLARLLPTEPTLVTKLTAGAETLRRARQALEEEYLATKREWISTRYDLDLAIQKKLFWAEVEQVYHKPRESFWGRSGGDSWKKRMIDFLQISQTRPLPTPRYLEQASPLIRLSESEWKIKIVEAPSSAKFFVYMASRVHQYEKQIQSRKELYRIKRKEIYDQVYTFPSTWKSYLFPPFHSNTVFRYHFNPGKLPVLKVGVHTQSEWKAILQHQRLSPKAPLPGYKKQRTIVEEKDEDREEEIEAKQLSIVERGQERYHSFQEFAEGVITLVALEVEAEKEEEEEEEEG